MTYIWVAVGGAIGSVMRFWLSVFAAKHWGEAFPWGTIMVNVSGSFAIGFFATLTEPDGRWTAGVGLRPFFMAGICGGYTTFSAFSLQTLKLMKDGQWLYAGMNVVGSVVLCLVAVWLGHLAGLAFNPPKGP